MKKGMKLTAILLLLLASFLLASCDSGSSDSEDDPTPPPTTVAVESVSLDKAELTLKTGKDSTLTATVLPKNATDKSVTWSSDDETVATVDNNGKVTGVSVGTATITVKTKDGGKTADCEVTVSANTYTIRFDANGGSGTMSDVPVEAGTSYEISENKFTAPAVIEGALKRTFKCWNTVADGSGTAYAEGDTILAVTADTKLYAQWTNPLFSVSATEKVYFAKGNLQAVFASAGNETTWKFADHQYDYIGAAVANTSINGVGTVSEAGTVDLFGWSTDSTGYGINNSTTSSDYVGNLKDWGEIGTLPGNGSTTKVWRTLSKDEWDYLINRRSNSANLRKYGVTVCEKPNCLILAPDNFSGTIVASYDASTWPAAEAAGLVCLPASGYRYGSGLGSELDIRGYYWSSTLHQGGGMYYYLMFDSDEVKTDFNIGYSGRFVRLVCGEK